MNNTTTNEKVFSNYHAQGFVLAELLATIVILLTILFFTVPTTNNLLSENRTIARVNTLVSSLYYARSYAVQSGNKAVFCKSLDGKACGGKWKSGQLIKNSNGQVLHVFPPLPGNDNLVWNSSGGKDEQVEWLPNGRTNGQRGTFYYCTDNAFTSRAIVLLNTGRVYVAPIKTIDYGSFCVPTLNVSAAISHDLM